MWSRDVCTETSTRTVRSRKSFSTRSTRHFGPTPAKRRARQSSGAGTTDPTEFPVEMKQVVQTFEINLLNQGMEKARFNQRQAAELLGLTYHQLRGYLKKYELLKSVDGE